MIVYVFSEFDPDGEEDIWMQLKKLSEETWNVPEHDVLDVFVVIVEEFITSEKVTEIFEVIWIAVLSSSGEIEDTVGAVVSSLKA